ncbi:MAG: hypothetical protein AAF799_25955 [Myxococcota bacterium]
MLTIRSDQLWTMVRDDVDPFRGRARVHLREYFAEQIHALSAAQIDDAIEHCVQRGLTYGLRTERDLLRYLTLMFVFGRDFDGDARFAWAGQILSGPGSASFKTSRLQADALRAQSEGEGYLASAPREADDAAPQAQAR